MRLENVCHLEQRCIGKRLQGGYIRWHDDHESVK
jgi:hypothetical protein